MTQEDWETSHFLQTRGRGHKGPLYEGGVVGVGAMCCRGPIPLVKEANIHILSIILYILSEFNAK